MTSASVLRAGDYRLCAGALCIALISAAAALVPATVLAEDAAKLSAPTDFKASTDEAAQITLTWTGVTSAKYYLIFVGKKQGGEATQYALATQDTTAVMSSKILGDGTGPFWFQVKAASSTDSADPTLSGPSEASGSPASTNANFRNIQAYFHTGATLLDPYHVNIPTSSSTPMTIAPATSTDANAFLEYVYTNRWAWNAQRSADTPWQDGQQWPDGHKKEGPCSAMSQPGSSLCTRFPGHGLHLQIDVEARLGYTFASGSTPTANTLVGSGNFNGEISVGSPLFQARSANDKNYNFSIGPAVGYGVVTEKGALASHPEFFAGVAYDTSFGDPVGTTDDAGNLRDVLLHFAFYRAAVDSVRYASNDTVDIVSTNGNLPRYFKNWTYELQTELLYPVNKDTLITFNAAVYPQLHPGLWNIRIGVTTAFSTLFSSFFK